MKVLSRPISYVDDWGKNQKLHFVFDDSSYEILKSDPGGHVTKLFSTANMAIATLRWKKYLIALERTGEYDLSDMELL